MNAYVTTRNKHGHFHSRTLLATFHIHDFYSVISHDSLLDSLGRFLVKKLPGNRLQNLTIITIENLTELFLKNIFFYFNNQIYRCRKGIPEDLCFSETLANIFLLEWQYQHLLSNSLIKDAFYRRFVEYFFSFFIIIFRQYHMFLFLFHRYKNMAFFIYHGTNQTLENIFNHLNQTHSDIQIEHFFGTNVHFLNIQIDNQQGHLHTSVYHNPTIEPYTLPYVIGHTELIYGQYFHSALIRAVCYCTNMYDFDRERLYLELTFLINGFPLSIIEYYLQKFFRRFKVPLSFQEQLLDATVYEQLRREMFQYIDQQKVLTGKTQEFANHDHFFHFYYRYEWGRRRKFNQQFRELWSKYIATYPMLTGNCAQINLTTKHLHSLNALLAREKPVTLISKKRKIFL